MQTANYKGNKDQGDCHGLYGLYTKPLITVLDNKNLPIGIEMSIQFQPIMEQARKEQEIRTIQGHTKLIEVTTQARAEAEKKRIGADAKAYQIEKEAEAVTEANTMIAKSISQPLIDYKSVERWSGQYQRNYCVVKKA